MIIPQAWLPSGGITLEPNALVTASSMEGNIVLAAGPGAGKTELLAQRADFLLRTGQCRYPRRILAISVKVDAATNLRNRVKHRCAPELAARLDSSTFHSFALRLIDAFRPVLTGIDALDPDYTVGTGRIFGRQLDFESMAPLAATILQASPVARSALRQTYGFVFLDEFQDCTADQYELIKTAFHGTNTQIVAVGDTKQRIMRWAGALDGVLAKFAVDFEARSVTLYSNFRSQPRLRRMQNAMIKIMEPASAVNDVELAVEGGQIDILRYEDSDDEARDLAERIYAWIQTEGVPAAEIAILVRTHVDPYTQALRTELRARGISFRMEADLQDLATEPIARLIVEFLTVVTGDREPDAYARVMTHATGWGADDQVARRRHSELKTAMATAASTYQQSCSHTWRQLAEQFLVLLGVETLAGLAPQYQSARRLAELTEQTLTRLEELVAETTDLSAALREFSGGTAVKLMSIHKAKGLEFDNVVVLAVENEMFWGDAEEQRSNYFVAISRARRRLCLTVCARRPLPLDPPGKWVADRTDHEEFLSYAR